MHVSNPKGRHRMRTELEFGISINYNIEIINFTSTRRFSSSESMTNAEN